MKNIDAMAQSSKFFKNMHKRRYLCLLNPHCIQQIVQKLLAVLLLEPLKSRSPIKEAVKNLNLHWEVLNETMSP